MMTFSIGFVFGIYIYQIIKAWYKAYHKEKK